MTAIMLVFLPIRIDNWGAEEDEQPEFDTEDLIDRYHVSISHHSA